MVDISELGASEPDSVTVKEYARAYQALKDFADIDLTEVDNSFEALDAEAGLVGHDLSRIVISSGSNEEIAKNLTTPVWTREFGNGLIIQATVLKVPKDKMITVNCSSKKNNRLFYSVTLPVRQDFTELLVENNDAKQIVTARDNTEGNGVIRYPLKDPSEVREYLRIVQMAVQDVLEVIDKPQNNENDKFFKVFD